MTKFYKNQFFWISLSFTALVAWGYVIAQKTQVTESSADSARTQQEKTAERARLIGRHLIETKFIRKVFSPTAENLQTRGLASVPPNTQPAGTAAAKTETDPKDFQMLIVEEGQMGRDTWGHPFSYRKSKNKLYIWSLGPNHKLDSTPEQIESTQGQVDDLVLALTL